MFTFLVVLLLISNVFSKEIWPGGELNGPLHGGITLKKDEPLNLPVHGNLTLSQLKGTIYSNSLSQLNVTDLRISFTSVDRVEAGGLCSSPTLRRLEFDAGENFKLTKDVLKNCENLEELLLRGNHFTSSDGDAFQNLPNLKNLLFFEFKIDNDTRSLFKDVPSLEYLSIRRLSFQRFDRETFADLKNLKELEIRDTPALTNDLAVLFNSTIHAQKLVVTDITSSLSSEAVAPLTVPELHLSFKYLQGIEPRALCSSRFLKRFKLEFREHDSITFSEIFKNCENLEKLAIKTHFNQFEEDSFDLPNLTSLSLSTLRVQHLTRNHFKKLPLLEVLHLHQLRLGSIDEDAFTDLKNLRTLSIAGNENFRRVPTKLFANTPKLENLVLFGNGIQSFSWHEFNGLTELKKLNIGGNFIRGINAERIAQKLPNLNYLYVSGRNFICGDYAKSSFEELRSKLNHSVEIVCENRFGYFAPDFGF